MKQPNEHDRIDLSRTAQRRNRQATFIAYLRFCRKAPDHESRWVTVSN
jgi:hypothetical protein